MNNDQQVLHDSIMRVVEHTIVQMAFFGNILHSISVYVALVSAL